MTPCFWSARALILLLLSVTLSGSLLAQRSVDGILLPAASVRLSASTPGVIVALPVEEGDTLAAGEIVWRLDDEEERLLVARAETVLEKRERDYASVAQLFAQNVVSEEEALEQEVELEVARLDTARARADLARRQVHAPIAGVVVRRAFNEGEWVNPGDVVIEIFQIDAVEAEVLVAAAHALPLQVGQPLPVVLPLLDNRVVAGKLTFVDPRIDPASGLQRLRVTLPNDTRELVPGMRIRVKLP